MKTLLVVIINGAFIAWSLQAADRSPYPVTLPAKADDPVFTPAELVQAMHKAFGNNHSRAVFAKGIILQGEFRPDQQAKELTKAPHLQGATSKVTVRFSNFSGNPKIPDNDPLANPHGMAIRFALPNGGNTDLVAHSYNGFAVSTTDEFRQLLLALARSGGWIDSGPNLDEFLASHPTAKKFTSAQTTPASFATANYYGVGSFKFTNAKGESHNVRYQVIPEAGERLLTDDERAKQSTNYLVDEIKVRVAAAPVVFKLYAQVAEAGDKIDDPSVVWPDTRKRVLLGRLEIRNVTANTFEEDKNLVFSPSNLPTGVQTADQLSSFYSKVFRLSAMDEKAVAAEESAKD
jgi:catalase